RIGMRCAVPDWRMWTLHRFGLHKVVFVVVEAALEVENVSLERTHQHSECFLIHGRCLRGIDSKTLMFDERTAAAHAHGQTAAAQLVEHADFFVEAQRVVKRQYVDERTQPDGTCPLNGACQKHAWARRHSQWGRVMLGEVIAVET